MTPLRFVLCCDGPSDEMLLPVVVWTLRQHAGASQPIDSLGVVADTSVERRAERAAQLYPDADLLVVHRDAEVADADIHDRRTAEVRTGLATASFGRLPPYVCVVPVRMAEAWLLFDERAVRLAANNPRGKVELGIPRRGHDTLPDPKDVLRQAMIRASELSGRKLKLFARDCRPVMVAAHINDFSPLRRLAAFGRFEAAVKEFVAAWCSTRDEPE